MQLNKKNKKKSPKRRKLEMQAFLSDDVSLKSVRGKALRMKLLNFAIQLMQGFLISGPRMCFRRSAAHCRLQYTQTDYKHGVTTSTTLVVATCCLFILKKFSWVPV